VFQSDGLRGAALCVPGVQVGNGLVGCSYVGTLAAVSRPLLHFFFSWWAHDRYIVILFRETDMLSTCLDLALLCHPVLVFVTMSRPKITQDYSRLQYFVFSFLSILAIRYASTSYFSVPVSNEVVLDVCQTYDQPNPIASLYPNNATGTLNGTVAIIPISLQLARSIIPPQYRILEHAYRALLPSFPKGMYPAILQALHDHEVQAFGYKIPDFSVSSQFSLSITCSS
jgi:hypothetical protein